MSDSRADFDKWLSSSITPPESITEYAWMAWQAARAQSREYERGFNAACKLNADISQPEHKLTDAVHDADLSCLMTVGRNLDKVPQPYAGAIVLLETIAQCGAQAFYDDGTATPNRDLCLRLARELLEVVQPAAATVPDSVAQRFREELEEFAFGERLALRAREQLLNDKTPAAQPQDDGEKQ